MTTNYIFSSALYLYYRTAELLPLRYRPLHLARLPPYEKLIDMDALTEDATAIESAGESATEQSNHSRWMKTIKALKYNAAAPRVLNFVAALMALIALPVVSQYYQGDYCSADGAKILFGYLLTFTTTVVLKHTLPSSTNPTWVAIAPFFHGTLSLYVGYMFSKSCYAINQQHHTSQ